MSTMMVSEIMSVKQYLVAVKSGIMSRFCLGNVSDYIIVWNNVWDVSKRI